ncbi:peptidase dimerization domain-containing protein [Streptomyces sp. NPDC005065]|uniref:peptidase dimerization domain-containing protein n=1 Tax=Streptomyces sp. NPDC005065 TaxID=3154461 RepID=UPI0033AD7900
MRLMVHAAPDDSVGASSLAIGAWDITYRGKPSHAALAPWEGINALDAMTVVHTAVGLLRRQLPPGVVVHGIVTDGGQAVNVIPARTRARCEVRALTVEQLGEAWQRVRARFEAGALATGAELELHPHGRGFADLRQDPDMTEAYVRALGELGRTAKSRHGETMASTDMGNVSQLIPTIHPTIGYDTEGAKQHTPEFTAYGKSPGADRAVLDGATALALTGARLATSQAQRSRLLDGVRRRQRSRPTGRTARHQHEQIALPKESEAQVQGGVEHGFATRRSTVRYRWSCLRRYGSPSRFPVAGLLACGENGGRKAIEEVGIRCEALP